MPRHLVTTAALATVLAAFAMGAINRPAFAGSGSAHDKGAFDIRAFDGIWRSRGYGWLWQVEDGQVERFDIGDGFCIARGEGTIGPENQAQLVDDDGVMRLLREDPDYLYTFERLPQLPATCAEAPDAGPVATFDALVAMFDAHYAFFEQRGVDWPGLVAAARTHVTPEMDDAALLAVFRDLITPLGDSHVGIEAEIGGREESVWAGDEGPREGPAGPPAVPGTWNFRAAEALLGTSAREIDDGRLTYGLLEHGIGYLKVRSMAGMEPPALEAALDEALRAFTGAPAVIVDVGMNTGGYDSFARRIARRFAAAPTVAYSKRAGDFAGDVAQEIVLRPPDAPIYLGPVYLITGPETLSAAEIFTMAMRALPNVVHLGETTDGALSDELWKRLPNGWTLSLSNEIYLDSEGALWEGRGIPPEIPLGVENRRDVTEQDRQTVRDVAAFIEARLP